MDSFYLESSTATSPSNVTRFRAVHKSVAEPLVLPEMNDGEGFGGVRSWITDHGVYYSFNPGEKPFDQAYKLKVSETKPYIG